MWRARYASAGGGDARIVARPAGAVPWLVHRVRALRDTEARIASRLADAGISLYAQHVDRLDTGALVDLFRAEEMPASWAPTPCAMRGCAGPVAAAGGVRQSAVAKPTILHKARRARFGKGY